MTLKNLAPGQLSRRIGGLAAALGGLWLGLASLTSCGGSGETDSGFISSDKRAVILDTDMNGDDWTALLYLLNRPDLELIAVTIPGTGIAECDTAAGRPTAAKNALNLIKLAEREDPRRPVACGRTTPLAGSGTFPAAWRSDAGKLLGLAVPMSAQSPDPRSATEVLTAALEKLGKPITIVATGPLTNIGEVLSKRPELAKNIESIWIMAGAVTVKGNLVSHDSPITDNTSAEWNAFIDPRALKIVLKSGAKVKLVPLDGTNHAQVTLPFRNQLGNDRGTPVADFAYQYYLKESDFIASGNYYFWDPLVAAALTDPMICKWNYDPLTGTTKDFRIAVVEDEGKEYGRTMQSEDGFRVDLCTEADGVRFEQLFIDVLNKRYLGED